MAKCVKSQGTCCLAHVAAPDSAETVTVEDDVPLEAGSSSSSSSSSFIPGDHGVPRTQIASLICNWPRSIGVCLNHFRKCVEEVREKGYDPSSAVFIRAVVVLSQLGKAGWERKTIVYKSWGWSEKDILVAFRKNPWSLMTSESKIMAVMKFFVEKMDCESLYLAKHPNLLMYSLEKRLIPRALVLHFLLRNKLIDKKPNLNTLFVYSEKLFLEKFVNCFDEAPQLLKLYRDQSDLAK